MLKGTILRVYLTVVMVALFVFASTTAFLWWSTYDIDDERIDDAFALGPILAAEIIKTSEDPDAMIAELNRSQGVQFMLSSRQELPPKKLAELREIGGAVYFPRGGSHWLAIEMTEQDILLADLGSWELPGVRHWTLAVLISLGIWALTTFMLVSPVLRQMSALECAAKQIGDGRWDVRVPASGTREQQDLATAFNTMAERVSGALRAQHELLRSVVHELRTPLARLRFRVETLSDSASGGASGRTSPFEDDLDEIDELLEELLTNARLEAGVELARVEIPVSETLAAVARAQVEATGRRQIKLAFSGAEGEVLRTHARLFERALGNLLRNALLHAKTRVAVEVVPFNQGLQIAISDDGAGIAPEHREHAFAPFWRGPEVERKGSGLGLAIVRNVLLAHEGTVCIEDSSMGGCRVVTSWPGDATQTAQGTAGSFEASEMS